jgi:hypothetical protein
MIDEPDEPWREVFGAMTPANAAKTPGSVDDRLTLAADSATEPGVLAVLATAAEAPIRRAVAANPNAGPDTLVRLAGEFPDEFFANPALALCLLENPGLLADMPEETLSKLMPHPAMPAGLLLEATRHRAFYVRRAAAQNPRMPPEALVDLAEKQSYFEEVAANPSTPAEYLEKLARHEWPAVRRAVAGNPSLSFGAIALLANDADAKVRKVAVRHPTLNDPTYAQLAKHESPLARLAVAECERTPARVLEALEGDADGAVRFSAQRTRSKQRRAR